MKRVELKCYECGQILGHMTIPISDMDNNNYISSTTIFGEFSPICCPVCEVKRLRGEEEMTEGGAE